MVLPTPLDDVRVRAVSEALGPYAWREFTPEMVCRRALATLNGRTVTGAQPVSRPDEWTGALVAYLARYRWRSLTVSGLSRLLVTALDMWWYESQWLEVELRWLLDGDGKG